jgi:divalent metal cation (Fe/Co/Zn/Cd) transporter
LMDRGYSQRGVSSLDLFSLSRRYRDDEFCFGSRRGSNWFGIFIGFVIILAGVVALYEGQFWWASWDKLWPLVVMVLGLIIIVNTLTRRW